jgi:hypothetical protein
MHHIGRKMRKKNEYDFQALLEIAVCKKTIADSVRDMTVATIRLCVSWRDECSTGPVDWLYNERPDIARAIEQEYELFGSFS